MTQIILAAGKGTRFGESIQHKSLTMVGSKTLLERNIELGASVNVEHIIIVVGHNAESIYDFMSDKHFGIPVDFVHQEPQLGIAHAIQVSSDRLPTPFFMCLADELLVTPRIKDMLNYFRETQSDCVCGMTPDKVEKIVKAYTMRLTSDNSILELIEKPSKTFNNFKGTGYCMMKPTMLNVLTRLKVNATRNEYEMGDWIQLAINEGLNCKAFELADSDLNINDMSDLKEAVNIVEG